MRRTSVASASGTFLMMSPDEHFCPDCFDYCDCADLVCSHCDDADGERDFDWSDFSEVEERS